MVPPPTPTQPANQAYFNTILNPNPNPSLSTASPSGANNPLASTSATTTPTRARTPASKPYSPAFGGAAPTSASREKERRMRSAQARNKNYLGENTEGGASGKRGGARRTMSGRKSPENFETRQRRKWAGTVLSSMELVIWYSGVRNESVSQTRTYFQNIVLGLPEPDSSPPPSVSTLHSQTVYIPQSVWKEEWEIPESQRVRIRDRDKDGSGGGGGNEDTAMSGMGSGSPARRDRDKGKDREKDKGKRRISSGVGG